MARHTIVLLPGDGIGPEVTSSAQPRSRIRWSFSRLGRRPRRCERNRPGPESVLPDHTVEAIRTHKIALKGPITTPVGKGFKSVNVQLRQKLNLYAAVRPVRSLPGVKTRYENVDMVIVRENTEGLYSGIENEIVPGVVTSLKIASRDACTRIAKYAFKYASERDRKKVTVFHKANIMKLSDGLFLDCAERCTRKNILRSNTAS